MPKLYTYEDISSIHMKLWRILAILPFKGQSLSFIGSRLLLLNFQIMNFIYYTMHIGYGIRMIANQKFEIDFICELVMVNSLSLRYLLFCLRHEGFGKLLCLCQNLWENNIGSDEIETVKEFGRKVFYYRNFFIWNSASVVTMFLFTSQFIKYQSGKGNGTEIRVLPFRFYIDVQEEPAFTLVTILQGIVNYHAVAILVGNETIGPFLVMMACGYLRTIQNRFLTMAAMGNSEDPNDCGIAPAETMEKLSIQEVTRCAIFHQKVMKFCEKIERFMSIFFMIMIVCSVYNLSLIGLQLLKNDGYFMKYVTLLGLNFLQLYICQWAPQQLLTESEAVAEAAYFAALAHREIDIRSNKILLLVMMRAQKPVQLTAGGYVKLSMETLGTMIKNAFSFFTVVRSFES